MTRLSLKQNMLHLSEKVTHHDTAWTLSLFGTAIGAGVLFLPIQAGLNGLFPMIIMLLLAFPMTYLSHRALSRFVFSGTPSSKNITDVILFYIKQGTGRWLNFIYFLSIFPIVLMYSVAITNTLQHFLIHQLQLPSPPRALLALILILGFMAVIRLGQTQIIRVMSTLVYPFIFTLWCIAFALIPHWNSSIMTAPQVEHPALTIWLVIPLMIFSFNHSPIISSFAMQQKKRYPHDVDHKVTQLLIRSHLMMVITVMFFVLSCVLSLSPNDLMAAKAQNISILSYLANHFDTPIISIVAPIIALIAIFKSFLGHYLGAREGLHGVLNNLIVPRCQNHRYLHHAVEGVIMLSCWTCATLNPNILNMIETLCGPMVAGILFLMPMYAFYSVPALSHYRNPWRDGFVMTMGLIAMTAIFYTIIV